MEVDRNLVTPLPPAAPMIVKTENMESSILDPVQVDIVPVAISQSGRARLDSVFSDDFEEGRIQLPYNTAVEKVTENERESFNFQVAITRGMQIATKIVQAISAAGVTKTFASELQGNIETAEELKSFEPQSTHTIAVLGESGAGEI
jgi:hypothetical protein